MADHGWFFTEREFSFLSREFIGILDTSMSLLAWEQYAIQNDPPRKSDVVRNRE